MTSVKHATSAHHVIERQEQACDPQGVVKGPSQRSKDLSTTNIVTISDLGDIILNVGNDDTAERVLFKVSSSALTSTSRYFAQLLDPEGWQEGRYIVEARRHLLSRYKAPSGIPDEQLPQVNVLDIGQTSPLKSIKPIMTDFLRILHRLDVLTASKAPPRVNIANLAVLSDRFDAVDAVSSWAHSKKNITIPLANTIPPFDEEVYRQRLLTCLSLTFEARLATYSMHLVVRGSCRWTADDELPDEAHHDAIWWDLPGGLEDELKYRHDCILDTIFSLQDHLLEQYTSKDRQCRLGYDSSPQCDAFQLGQFVRFLSRIGTLQLTQSSPKTPTLHDIRALLKDLRTCPAYQVDTNHAHCGPKKLLIAGLDLVERSLNDRGVGICAECWNTSRPADSWMSMAVKQPFRTGGGGSSTSGHIDVQAASLHELHEKARAFFTGHGRDWDALLYRDAGSRRATSTLLQIK